MLFKFFIVYPKVNIGKFRIKFEPSISKIKIYTFLTHKKENTTTWSLPSPSE